MKTKKQQKIGMLLKTYFVKKTLRPKKLFISRIKLSHNVTTEMKNLLL